MKDNFITMTNKKEDQIIRRELQSNFKLSIKNHKFKFHKIQIYLI